MTSLSHSTLAHWMTAASVCWLTACGGGGDTSTGTATTEAVAQSTSAAATVLPSDATSVTDAAVDAVLAVGSDDLAALQSTAASARLQAKAAGGDGHLSGSVDCEGGGSMVLDLTGPSLATVLNGVPDAGERYSVTFVQCRGSGSQVVLQGELVLDVMAADDALLSVGVSIAEPGLSAELPGGAASVQGDLLLTRTTTLDTAELTTQTSHWQTPAQGHLTLNSARQGLSRNYTLSELDLTRSQTWQADVQTGSGLMGGLSLAASSSSGQAGSIRLSITSALSFDAAGMPTAGSLNLTLPRSAWGVTVGNGRVTVTVDDGPDGVVDLSRTWEAGDWIQSAGL